MRDAMVPRLIALGAFAFAPTGCGTTNDDVVGPFTGETYRYALDSIVLPRTNGEARELGADLDGNRTVDNQLGMVISTLTSQGNVTSHSFDMIAGGAIPTSLEIVADDLENDLTVGVRYLGSESSESVEVGGRFVDGWFRSNRTATTRVPGEAELFLPVFREADPSVVTAIGLQIILQPDGAGGFVASVHGAVPTGPTLFDVVYRAIVQMIESDPGSHRGFVSDFDWNPRDGVLSYEEIARNSLLISLLAPDVEIDGRLALSIGFRAHFRPCPSGQCLDSEPFDHCFDRVLDGDETDVDCGGSCHGCEAGARCVTGSDCETTTCESSRCGPPSCTNGARDGLESDVDCGANCGDCANGQRCYTGGDCASGVCGSLCTGPYCGDYDEEICRP